MNRQIVTAFGVVLAVAAVSALAGAMVAPRDALAAVVLGSVLGLLGGGVAAGLVHRLLQRIEDVERVSGKLASGSLDPGPVDFRIDDALTPTMRNLLHLMGQLQGLKQHLELAAGGDLSRTTVAEGELARAVANMLTEQRQVVEQLGRTSDSVERSSARLLSTSKQQQANAAQQAAVVEEILRTMQGVADNASRVAERAEEVLQLAERTSGNNVVINERIDALARHAARIGEVLEVISDIAHKSEILALNAALEGTRAGEAGRGFSLVAGEMGQLSERVLAAVVDIQELTADITSATEATVIAADQASEQAAATAGAAREIRASVQQQTTGTQQVGRGLEEISAALRESAQGARTSSEDAGELADQSARLQELLARFEI